MMWESWLAISLATALLLALLAAPVLAGGKPGFVGPGAGRVRGNASSTVHGLDRASQQASPPGQQGIQDAKDAILTRCSEQSQRSAT